MLKGLVLVHRVSLYSRKMYETSQVMWTGCRGSKGMSKLCAKFEFSILGMNLRSRTSQNE